MSCIISIVNNKGGVGKTFLSVNLAHALGLRDQKVLLVDLDSQCNSTSFFGNPNEYPNTLYDILYETAEDVKECIYPTDYKNVHILPNHEDTLALEPDLLQRPDRGFNFLKAKLEDYARSHYDFVLCDCPPNLSTFVYNAMVASDFVIVPIEAGSKHSLEGLARTIRRIDDCRNSLNPKLRFLRLLINKADKRTHATQSTIEFVSNYYPGQMFAQVISQSVLVKTAETIGQTIIKRDPSNTASRQIKSIAQELIEIVQTEGGVKLSPPSAYDDAGSEEIEETTESIEASETE